MAANDLVAFCEVEIFLPDGRVIPHGTLLTEGGLIRAVGYAKQLSVPAGAKVITLPGKKVLPGFIDVHFHGLHGYDVFGAGMINAARALPQYGVTSFLATTITLPLDEVFGRLRQLAEAMAEPPAGARCLGIHVEGPHLSPKRPGMANAAWCHPLSADEFGKMQECANGLIRMITFAPEEGDALSVVPALIDQGVVPVMGHSDASYELAARAASLGVRHVTHMFNALNPFHHRAPGVIGAVLALPDITAQLIADGHHVHEGAMRTLLNAVGYGRVCLISDAAPFAGLPDGTYPWQEYTLVVGEGMCRLPNGTLAGAHALMDTGFRNLMTRAGLTPSQASVCASAVPARELGLSNRKGVLLAGFDADIAVLDESFRPYLTMVGGDVVWSRE